MAGGRDGDSELATAFAGGPAFVPYLAAGDPDYDSSIAYVEALARGGADVIELGLPFSEPIAEGSTIQGAVVRALEAGMTPDQFFEFVEDVEVDVPLVCMTYYNLIYQYGDDQGPRPFVERAAAAGLSGFVVPDLPAEEAEPLRAACDEFGLDLVFIVAPTTTGERLHRNMEHVSGYVYVQARTGVTGAKDDVSDQTERSLDRLREYDVPGGADGVIVGSALVDIVAEGLESDTPTADVADRLEETARELKRGADRGYKQRVPQAEGN